MKRSFPPFLTAPDNAVLHDPWRVANGSTVMSLPNAMPHWDYQTALVLSASFRIETAAILKACHLDDGTELELVISASSDHTRTERIATRAAVDSGPACDIEIEFSLPGLDLGGMLSLTALLVTRTTLPLSQLAPTRTGSILWSSTQKTSLQGNGAQFPTDALDFAHSDPAHAGAGWSLYIDTADASARFLASVRLSLNTSHAAVRALLHGSADLEAAVLGRFLQWDVTHQLAIAALDVSEVCDLDFDLEATSLAGVLRNLLAAIWPGRSVEEITALYSARRSEFELDIQAYCRVIG